MSSKLQPSMYRAGLLLLVIVLVVFFVFVGIAKHWYVYLLICALKEAVGYGICNNRTPDMTTQQQIDTFSFALFHLRNVKNKALALKKQTPFLPIVV